MQALVIDDSRAIRRIIGQLMRSLGFEVLEADNGQTALNRLAEAPGVAVALVDWNMPQMNGIEFVEAVRAQQAYDGMRLIMVTTESEMDKVTRALQAGADEYVMKPFTREMITEKLTILGVIG